MTKETTSFCCGYGPLTGPTFVRDKVEIFAPEFCSHPLSASVTLEGVLAFCFLSIVRPKGLTLQNHCYQLGATCSNTGACGEHFTFQLKQDPVWFSHHHLCLKSRTCARHWPGNSHHLIKSSQWSLSIPISETRKLRLAPCQGHTRRRQC